MDAEGRARLSWFEGEVTTRRFADMRYGEQVFKIAVPLDDIDWHATPLSGALADRFHAAHEQLYTYALRDQEVVVVNARLSVIGRLPATETVAARDVRPDIAPKTNRAVYLNGWAEVPVFDFQTLAADQPINGPAIVESDTTTILLRRNDKARFSSGGWLEIAIA